MSFSPDSPTSGVDLLEELSMPCLMLLEGVGKPWGNIAARRLLADSDEWVEELRSQSGRPSGNGAPPTVYIDLSDCGHSKRYVFEELALNPTQTIWVGWDSSRSSFVRGMELTELVARKLAHELKNPLQPIQLVMEKFLKIHPESAAEARIVLRQVERIKAVLDQFRHFNASMQLQLAPADLVALLNEMITDHRALGGDRIRWSFSPPKSGAPLIQVDAKRLGQVFTNLIQNAIEAMPDGGLIQIGIGVHQESSRIHIEISDTGQGLLPEAVKNLFTPFATTKLNGTGLGLVVSRQIVQLHGGDLLLASQEYIGTTATVILPCASPT